MNTYIAQECAMPKVTDAVIPIDHATFAMLVVAVLAWCLRGAAEHRSKPNG